MGECLKKMTVRVDEGGADADLSDSRPVPSALEERANTPSRVPRVQYAEGRVLRRVSARRLNSYWHRRLQNSATIMVSEADQACLSPGKRHAVDRAQVHHCHVKHQEHLLTATEIERISKEAEAQFLKQGSDGTIEIKTPAARHLSPTI